MTDPKEPQEEEIDPSEDRDNDADYYNELESNFNNILNNMGMKSINLNTGKKKANEIEGIWT